MEGESKRGEAVSVQFLEKRYLWVSTGSPISHEEKQIRRKRKKETAGITFAIVL